MRGEYCVPTVPPLGTAGAPPLPSVDRRPLATRDPNAADMWRVVVPRGGDQTQSVPEPPATVHWGYAPPWAPPPAPPRPATKRALSESDDGDDFSEESSKDQ